MNKGLKVVVLLVILWFVFKDYILQYFSMALLVNTGQPGDPIYDDPGLVYIEPWMQGGGDLGGDAGYVIDQNGIKHYYSDLSDPYLYNGGVVSQTNMVTSNVSSSARRSGTSGFRITNLYS